MRNKYEEIENKRIEVKREKQQITNSRMAVENRWMDEGNTDIIIGKVTLDINFWKYSL